MVKTNLAQASQNISITAFAKVRDNEEDAVYDSMRR